MSSLVCLLCVRALVSAFRLIGSRLLLYGLRVVQYSTFELCRYTSTLIRVRATREENQNTHASAAAENARRKLSYYHGRGAARCGGARCERGR